MSGISEREKKRKSVVGAIISDKEKKKKNNDIENRVQRNYYIDRDLYKALKMKSISEEINLTEAINEALRIGLKDYL